MTMASSYYWPPFIKGNGSKVLLLYIVTAYAINGIKTENSSTSSIRLIPPNWSFLCSLILNNTTVVDCDIGHDVAIKWKFDDLRNWTLSNSVNVTYHLNIRCVDGVNISLPWPFKSPGLIGLKVSNCGIENYYKNYLHKFEDYPDELEMFVIEQCVFIENLLDTLKVFSGSATKSFICGQSDSIKRYVYRNNTIVLRGNLSDINESNITTVNDNLNTVGIQCQFWHLHDIENTQNKYLSESHFQVFTKDSIYPSLTHCNYSHNLINKLPLVFQNFRTSFPKLEVLDLSHNVITLWDFSYHVTTLVESTYVDLRYNNITHITLDDMETLAGLEPAFVDIRDNPISCDCAMKKFMTELKFGSVFKPNMVKYKYIENMTCVTPESFKGIRLKEFNLDELPCEVDDSHWAYPTVICAAVTLIILSVILFCIVFHNRELIQILCLTRCNILLPMATRDTTVKSYDAFIAASEEDEDWVVDNLLYKLEDIDVIDVTEHASQTRKLNVCVPGRDFRPGAFTIDEIIDKTEKSRRTLVVLSKSFVESRMCGEMLRQAYFQSIVERRCHLVFVKLEQIDLNGIDSTLKRSLKLFTVLNVADRYFWDMIQFLLKTTSKKNRAKNSTTPDPEKNTTFALSY